MVGQATKKRAAADIEFKAPEQDSAAEKPKKKYPGPDERTTIVVGIGENGETADVKVPDPYSDTGGWIVIKRNEPQEVPDYILGLLKHMVIEHHDRDGSIRRLSRAPFHKLQSE